MADHQDSAQCDGKSFIDRMKEPRNGILLCLACSRTGGCRFGIHTETLLPEQKLLARMRCPDEYEASPGVAHGGWTAAVFDETCGHLPMRLGGFAVTGRLEIRYIMPVPVGVELEILAWASRRVANSWEIVGEMRAAGSDVLLSRAIGIFVERDMTHYEALERRRTETAVTRSERDPAA